jgi:hypothetical protein
MRRVSILIATLIVAGFPGFANDPDIVIFPPGAPGLRMFDPARPPIPLRPPEAAFCQFGPVARISHTPRFAFDGTTLTLVSPYAVSIAPSITIYLPSNFTEEIKEHENGHARLCAYEFTQIAQRLTAAAFAGAVGSRFVGRGASSQQRMIDASRQLHADGARRLQLASQNILDRVHQLNDIYDNLTQHGTNPAVKTSQGEVMAKQQFESAGPTTPAQPVATRSRPARSSRILPLIVVVCGGLLLVYGILSYARRA